MSAIKRLAGGSGRAAAAAKRRSPALGALAVSAVVAALASAPAASATTNYTWSGNSSLSTGWSDTSNWSGGSAPTGSIGSLTFGDLGGSCDAETSSDACYDSLYHLGFQTAQSIAIDDNSPYVITAQQTGGEDELTLNPPSGVNGITATPSVNGIGGPAQILLPLLLQGTQTWEVDGGSSGTGALAVAQAQSGQLNLDLSNGGILYADSLTPINLNATGDGAVAVAPIAESAINAALPPLDTTLTDGASLFVEAPSTTGGSITASGSDADQPVIAIGTGESPEAALTLTGGLTLDQWSNLSFDIDGPDFSQLSANGAVDLNDATIYLDQGWDNDDDSNPQCATLTPGQTFRVLQTYTGFGGDPTYFDAAGGFDELDPNETSSPLPISIDDSGCPTGTQTAYARLTYGPQAITATVISDNWAPVNTGAPSVAGNPVTGSTVTADPGAWTGSPTISYQWQRCTLATGLSCTDIPGATSDTYALTNTDVSSYVRTEVTATDTGQSSVADSAGLFGPVTAAPASAAPPTKTTPTPTAPAPAPKSPSRSAVTSALNGLAHPSGKTAITGLLKSGTFETGFHAPSRGSLSVAWTTTVVTGTGKHKGHKTVTVGTGSAQAGRAGMVTVKIHLTAAGKALLKKQHTNVAATEKFKPSGGSWSSVTKRFGL